MTKMVTMSSPNKGPDLDSPPKSQNLLKNPSSELCRFTDPEVDQFYTRFPPNTIFRAFDSSAKGDCVSSTWVCFPAALFQTGYSFPFPEFTQCFFTLTGLSYSQAMPMLWRVLYTFERLIRYEGLSFGLSELANLYNLVSHVSPRILFKAKPQNPLPLLKTTKIDTNWRNQFFFIMRDTIPLGNTLPKKWVLKGAQKSSSKSVSKFDLGNIDSLISPRSLKKELARGPSTTEPKTVGTRSKTCSKRKKPSDNTDDSFQVERHFHEVITEGFVHLQVIHEKKLAEVEQKVSNLYAAATAKDKRISQLEKEINGLEKKIMVAEIESNKVELEAAEEAKVCVARTFLQARIKMAEEAMDPAFDRSS
ncbi:hypothetical protein HanHA300_Chr06g0218761 [Helianthus annuus]|nr:hypothetical protein HanHA300_Chr06g0218761 [Helianthus annuus]KAJ0567621.1 hypothetical protein HanIR_Chr06g0286931 [Helianthus annuus]KAJ0916077.1 hypothetical protein HanPSC8_Chr06g0257411 [Helianthus annuus]